MEVGRSLGMTIHRLSRVNFENQAKALERLSSGLRINRAADDAAGLSISETFTSQVRGTQQAIRNAQDGISMLRTAEGAFGTIHDVLQRMRELCVQGANGTLTLADRTAIQQELQSLKGQIDQTAYFTTFNGLKLLVNQDKIYNPPAVDWSYSNASPPFPGTWSTALSAEAALGGPGGVVSGVSWQNLQDAKNQLPYIVDGAFRKAESMLMNSGIDEASITSLLGSPYQVNFVIDPSGTAPPQLSNALSITVNLYNVYGAGVPKMTLQEAFVQGVAHTLANREDIETSNNTDFTTFFASTPSYVGIRRIAQSGAAETYLAWGKPASFSFGTSSGTTDEYQKSAWFYRYMEQTYGQGSIDQIMHAIVDSNGGSISTALDNTLQSITGMTPAALEAAINAWLPTQTVPATLPAGLAATVDTTAKPLDKPVTLQVGADFGDTLDVTMLAGSLGSLDYVSMVNVMDQATAGASITTLDKAIAQVSNARARLGASENRLEHTINRLSSYEVDASAARSRIRDTDMADEMTTLTRAQVLSNSTVNSLSRFMTLQRDQVGSLLEGLSH